MPTRQECPNCKVILLLPDSGVGRCPRCKTVVRREAGVAPAAALETEEFTPVIPEIGEEHMVRPVETRVSPEPVPMPLPVPPPLPLSTARRGGRRRSLPGIDIAVPGPRPSKTVPIVLLSLGLILSLGMVIFSFIYLGTRAREGRPAFPPGVLAPGKR